MYIRLSITFPHTEHRLTGPCFALIDSLIVLSEIRSDHFVLTRCVGNLTLPHRIFRTRDGRDFFSFFKDPLPVLQNFNTSWRSHAYIYIYFILSPSRKHAQDTIYKITKACHFYKALLRSA